MLQLTAIRLIRWYHFEDETIPVHGATLLLGLNGAGKSTVLDAIQLCLTGDQTMVRFNKAANDTTRRTAYGYVRHEVLLKHDEEGTKGTQFRRGPCTGYIALQFDEVRDGRPVSSPDGGRTYTFGLALEAVDGTRTVTLGHFILTRLGVAGLPVKGADASGGIVVRSREEFRRAIRLLGRNAWLPDAQTYRQELRQRLGIYSDKFHRQLVHTLAYQPVNDVRKFVTDYLAEPRPVQTDALLDNLQHLKRFQAEAGRVAEEIEVLNTLCEQGEKVQRQRRVVEGVHYVALRAAVVEAERAIEGMEEEVVEKTALRADAEQRAELAEQRYQHLDREVERVSGLLAANPTHRQIEDLTERRDETYVRLEAAKRAVEDLADIIRISREAADAFLASPVRSLRQRVERRAADALFFVEGGDRRLEAAARALAALPPAESRGSAPEAAALGVLSAQLKHAKRSAETLAVRLSDRAADLKREGDALYGEEQELRRGRVRYDERAEGLRHVLAEHLRAGREPRLLCELIEVPNERWQRAVEAVLGGRRFTVLIAPDDFDVALDLYKKHRSRVVLPDRRVVSLYGVSLVNLAGVERDMRGRDVVADALAHEIETQDDLARLYVDFLLHDMICCDDERELKKHRRAIEPGGMRYQQHEAVQLDVDNIKPAIGAAARLRRLDEIGERLATLGPELARLSEDMNLLRGLADIADRALRGADQYERVAGDAARAADLAQTLRDLVRQLDSIDRSAIRELEEQREEFRKRRQEAKHDKETAIGDLSRAEETLKDLDRRLAETFGAHDVAKQRFAAAFGDRDPVEAYPLHERHFQKQLADTPASTVRLNFDRSYQGEMTKLAGVTRELDRLRCAYNQRFEMSLATQTDEDYAAFADQRDRLMRTELPRYEGKMAEEKERALQHLANDIVQQLSANFQMLDQEFALLNSALAKTPFNGDTYKFVKTVADNMKGYYSTILQAQGADVVPGGLWEALQQAERAPLREGLAKLLDGLVKAQEERVKTDLERIIDYRAYFTYDIRIQKAAGGWQSYTEVFGTGSGGQTQTPYYVAVLSAMRALYAARTKNGIPGCGLVLLDEAFKQLDGPRIEAVLHFGRDLGLQLVVAAPSEKVPLIGPHVDTSILIAWDEGTSRPEIVDFTKEFREPVAPFTPDAGVSRLLVSPAGDTPRAAVS